MSTKKNISVSVEVAKKGKVKKVVNDQKEGKKAPMLEFVAVSASDLKKEDNALKSAVIGALCVNTFFEVPLAVNEEGKQAYSLDNVRRATCAIYDHLQGKLSVKLVERKSQDNIYYVVIYSKTKRATNMTFSTASASDKKLPSSKKRKATASARKLTEEEKKAQLAASEREKRAADWKEEAKKQEDLNSVAVKKVALATSQNDLPAKKKQEAIMKETKRSALLANIMAIVTANVNLTEKQEQAITREVNALLN